MIDRLKNWYNLSKQYFFTYKDGFFNLSYLSNSPELIVKSSIKMPFMRHNPQKQLLSPKTPFLEGSCYYATLEEGLWLLYSNIYYKNKVSFTPIYDNKIKSNYYVIAVNFVENSFGIDYFESNNIKIQNQSISFIKPKSDTLHCHFKNSTLDHYVFYLSEDWVEKNILISPTASSDAKNLFLSANNKFITFAYNNSFDKYISKLSQTFKASETPNLIELKKITFSFLDVFFKTFSGLDGYRRSNLKLSTTIKLNNIEEYLLSNIYSKFPGIDKISKKFNISPTKLKADFKKKYNKTLLQFFQEKQMQLAFSYLEKGSMVKEVSKKFNYENSSKFSKTFQKYQGVLPSELT